MNFIKGKNLITTDEYVICPYCGDQSEHWRYLHWRHLKLKHEKTLQNVRDEFPDHPTMTKSFDDDRLKGAQMTAQTHNQLKRVNCIHCNKEMKVPNNRSNTQACQECLDKGLENPDGRTKESAQAKREETLMKNHGVVNPQQVKEFSDKATETCEKNHGGRGFGSKKLARKTRKVIKERYGADNIMQTEEGYAKFIEGLRKRYGKEINNAQDMKEVRDKTRKTMIEKIKRDGHHMEGKTYIEMYGSEAAHKLVELRRKFGAEGFKKSQEMGYGPSKPQLQIFDLILQIIPEAKLEFGQNLLYDDERYYYFLDIAIPDLKINIEYDCAWTHPDPEKDKFRDEVLKSYGWDVIRYFERIPTLEELQNDINSVL